MPLMPRHTHRYVEKVSSALFFPLFLVNVHELNYPDTHRLIYETMLQQVSVSFVLFILLFLTNLYLFAVLLRAS